MHIYARNCVLFEFLAFYRLNVVIVVVACRFVSGNRLQIALRFRALDGNPISIASTVPVNNDQWTMCTCAVCTMHTWYFTVCKLLAVWLFSSWCRFGGFSEDFVSLILYRYIVYTPTLKYWFSDVYGQSMLWNFAEKCRKMWKLSETAQHNQLPFI